jgi:DsbC/DsbD-like thiol-disulfide interchange protein
MFYGRDLCAGAVILASLCAASLGAGTAGAQTIVSTGESFLGARLLPGTGEPDGARMAGLRLTLADGWKTYWRSPGETGVPPVFDWSGSRNLREAEVFWPRPEMFESFGLRAVGYSDEVVLPVRLVPEDPARPIEVRLEANLGVCREICVLETVTLSETIEPGEAGHGAGQIARALAAVPAEGAASGLSESHCRITGAGEERRLEATLRFERPLSKPTVLVEGPETLLITAAKTRHAGDELHVTAGIQMAQEGGWIDRSAIRLTVLDEDFAADIRGCSAAPG